MDDALVNVDSVVIQSLMNGLKDRGLYDCVNIIVVSDHGNCVCYLFGVD